jgi:hypothetical protein
MPAAGKVDAAWVVEPQLSETLTPGGQVEASNYVDTAPDLPRWPGDISRASLDRLAILGEQDGIFTKLPVLDQLLP